MIERAPPKLALWLLEKWGSAYQSESLAGDLIEQYQEGRGRAWYWKQVTAAILIAQGRFIRNMPWATVARVVSRLIAETAAVLAFAVVVDQARRTHSLAQMMMNHPFNRTVIELIAVALIGFLVSIRPDKRRPAHAAINAVMLAFGVIALGAGTLTWADTLRSDTCRSAACACISR